MFPNGSKYVGYGLMLIVCAWSVRAAIAEQAPPLQSSSPTATATKDAPAANGAPASTAAHDDAQKTAVPPSQPPKLERVTPEIAFPHQPIILVGSGFDRERPERNQILADDRFLSVPVWVADAATFQKSAAACNAADESSRRKSIDPCLVGYVGDGQHIIVMSDVLSGSPFHSLQVVVGGPPSEPLSGIFIVSRWSSLKVKSISFVVALLIWIIFLAVAWSGAKFMLSPGISKQVTTTFLLDPETNTYSLSKVQFYLWTAAAAYGYTVLALSQLVVQGVISSLPQVPDSLPGVLAASVGTTLGASALTVNRGPKGAGEMNPAWSDLITAGGVVSVERVQFLIWTLLGVLGFVAAVLLADSSTMTTLPNIPTSLLTLGGISAAGYLGGKLVNKPGPVINQITVKKYYPDPPDPTLDPADDPCRAWILALDGRALSSEATFFYSVDSASEIQWIVPKLVHSGGPGKSPAFSKLDATNGKSNPTIITVDQEAGAGTVAKSLQVVVLAAKDDTSVTATAKITIKIVNPDGKYAVWQTT